MHTISLVANTEFDGDYWMMNPVDINDGQISFLSINIALLLLPAKLQVTIFFLQVPQFIPLSTLTLTSVAPTTMATVTPPRLMQLTVISLELVVFCLSQQTSRYPRQIFFWRSNIQKVFCSLYKVCNCGKFKIVREIQYI